MQQSLSDVARGLSNAEPLQEGAMTVVGKTRSGPPPGGGPFGSFFFRAFF